MVQTGVIRGRGRQPPAIFLPREFAKTFFRSPISPAPNTNHTRLFGRLNFITTCTEAASSARLPHTIAHVETNTPLPRTIFENHDPITLPNPDKVREYSEAWGLLL